MKDFLKNFIDEMKEIKWKSFVSWSIVVYFFFILSVGVGEENGGMLFIIFSFLLLIIYFYGKQIDKLKQKIKFLEEKWKHVDFKARLYAMKQLEEVGKIEDIDVSEIMENQLHE